MACRRFYQLRDRTRFRTWLVRMAWRLALDRQRTNRRRLARESKPAPSVRGSSGEPDTNRTTALDGLLARERREHLWAAIDSLPEKLRIVVVLNSIKEQDTAEVARLLGLPEGTVKSRLFLARRRLREYLKWSVNQ